MFQRPDTEARKALYKSVGGSWWKYVLSVMLVGFGVDGLEHVAVAVRKSHPLIAPIVFGNPGIVFVGFAMLLLVAGVGHGIELMWNWLRRHRREAAPRKAT
jgi:hypothetical protein